ncbi:MAG TPA: HAD family phosphatase [Vicinamibacterales bacterium]|nr:HAD family phosphatase [Vicinamibacterales bacterium]
MTRAVLWDLDGTLIDSEEFHWLSWRHALHADGVEISRAQFLASFGQRNDRILHAWLGEQAPADRVRRLGEAKEVEYRRLVETRGQTPLPGAADWLVRLHAAGWRQAIASSAPRLNVDVMLRVLSLTPYFDAIVSAEDVTMGKPDPQVFQAAAARLGVPPSHCVVVEDAAAGVEAARRAGMRSIGVNRTHTLDADLFARSLADLPPDAFDRILMDGRGQPPAT